MNRTRYIVDSVTINDLFLQIATKSKTGKGLILPRVPCETGNEDFPISRLETSQFSIRPCFAFTTNKAQRQSFSGAIGLDLPHDCFTHDQLLVAMSKITHPVNNLFYFKRTDNCTKSVLSKT